MKNTFNFAILLFICIKMNASTGVVSPILVTPYDVLNFVNYNAPFNNGVEKLDSSFQRYTNYDAKITNNFYYDNSNKVDSLLRFTKNPWNVNLLKDSYYYNDLEKEVLRRNNPDQYETNIIYDTTYSNYNALGHLMNSKSSWLTYFIPFTEYRLYVLETVYTRDALNRVTEKLIYWNPYDAKQNLPIPTVPPRPYEKYLYQYNAQNQVTNTQFYQNKDWFTSNIVNWSLTTTTQNSYNTNNKLTVSKETSNYAISTDSLFYDTNGKLIAFKKYFNGKINFEYLYTYTGNKIKSVIIKYQSKLYSKEVLNYNSNGQRIKYTTRKYKSTGIYDSISEYRYSYSSNKLQEINYFTSPNNGQSFIRRATDVLTYTGNGLINSHSSGLRNSSGFVATKEIKFFYSSSSANKSSQPEVQTVRVGTEMMDFTIYPNPASRSFSVNIPSVWNETPTIISLINIKGEVLKTIQTYSNELIETDNLPTGTYIVRIQNEERVATKKVIVLR